MVLSWFMGIWRWLAIIAAVASLTWLHGCQTGAQREKAAQAAQTAKAIEKARKADQSAAQAVSKAKQETEQSNADAKAAAAGSDDPLRAGLDSLRQ
jgi:outer membrane murein-binding lipoprotein Lpp